MSYANIWRESARRAQIYASRLPRPGLPCYVSPARPHSIRFCLGIAERPTGTTCRATRATNPTAMGVWPHGGTHPHIHRLYYDYYLYILINNNICIEMKRKRESKTIQQRRVKKTCQVFFNESHGGSTIGEEWSDSSRHRLSSDHDRAFAIACDALQYRGSAPSNPAPAVAGPGICLAAETG